MNKEEYDIKKSDLKEKLQQQQSKRRAIEMAYQLAMYKDPDWIRYSKLIYTLEAQIKGLSYDDNRVYQTQERARDSRLDCRSVPAMAGGW